MFSDPALAAALSWPAVAILALGAFVGGVASGGAGFGFAVVASAIWLHVIDPVRATFLIVFCGTVMQVSLIWPMRHELKPARLWPFFLGCAIGIPLGVWYLTKSEAGAVKVFLGAFLVAFGTYAIITPHLPVIKWGGRAADGAIGIVGGFMGGIGGYSGVIPTIWTQLRGWKKEAARAVYQPFILFAHIGVMLGIGAMAFNWNTVVLALIALPVVLFGCWVGWQIYGRLDERRFRQALALLLVISGAALVF
jgi:uncharacterized membrane protein YfcA